MPVRTTIYLEPEVLERLRRFIPRRGLSRFINDAVAEKAEALERLEVEAAMKEGYLATRDDHAELDRDWGKLDTENWPE